MILDAETAQKCKSGEFSKFIRNTAKIVIERDTQTGRTRSFVMIFVGSYNYLKKTRSMGKIPIFTDNQISMVLFYFLRLTVL